MNDLVFNPQFEWQKKADEYAKKAEDALDNDAEKAIAYATLAVLYQLKTK